MKITQINSLYDWYKIALKLNKTSGLFDNKPVKTMCMMCRKLKTLEGWEHVHNTDDFHISHGLCPDCVDDYKKQYAASNNWYKKAQTKELDAIRGGTIKTNPSIAEIEALKKTIPNMEAYSHSSVTQDQLIHILDKIMNVPSGDSANNIPKKGAKNIINLPNGEVIVISPTTSWKGTYKDKMYYIMFFKRKNELV